ncbi:hypothetical protein [Flavobacterium aestivum]|uniref:hypothetical protein n=1 Tax=Flavobacterium aestivum TaxID=3003257 RepID=UPI002286CA4A|nr:hypothetical protein [Flavobacterium aestivum]
MKNPKKLVLLIIFSMMMLSVNAQNLKTKTMEQTKNAKTKILDIKPSTTSSEKDFDFLQGKWKVHNRKLNSRLTNSDEWTEFEAELHMKKTLNGFGNLENFYSKNNGQPYEGMAIRLFNKELKLWKIYWIDSNGTAMDEKPVTGSFENGLGKFYANDIFNEKEILVLYQWDATNLEHPKWSQAFSTDNGKTWEWNWKMELSRIE